MHRTPRERRGWQSVVTGAGSVILAVRCKGNPPALPGRLPEFDSSGSVLRIRVVNRSRSTTGDSSNERVSKSESYEVGMQIPCGVHSEIPPQGNLRLAAQAFGQFVPGAGAAQGMRDWGRALDGRSCAYA